MRKRRRRLNVEKKIGGGERLRGENKRRRKVKTVTKNKWIRNKMKIMYDECDHDKYGTDKTTTNDNNKYDCTK